MTSLLERLSRHGEEPARGAVSAIHSGNIGDIIYALPTVRALGVSHLLLNVCEDPGAGGRLMTEAMARSMTALLLDQPGITTVDIVAAPIRVAAGFGHAARVSRFVVGLPLEHISPTALGVDYVLDRFRLQPLDRRHLVFAHAMACGARVDPARAWIDVPVRPAARNGIAVSVTPRYRNRTNERLAEILDGFGPVTLIGFRDEAPNYFGIDGTMREFADAKELAAFLAGCSAFVGASSFPAAVAEAMKVPRLIDLADGLINAFPTGPNGWAMPEATDDARRLLDGLLRAPESIADRVSPVIRSSPPIEDASCRFSLEWRQAEGEIIGIHRAETLEDLGRAPVRVTIPVPRLTDRPAGFDLLIASRVWAFEISNLRCVSKSATLWTANQPDDLGIPDVAVLSSPPGILRWMHLADEPCRVSIKVPEAILARFQDAEMNLVFDCRSLKPSETGQWATREILALGSALSRERNTVEHLQAELTGAREKQADVERQLTNVLGSTSWRLTAPLRAVRGLVKPKRGAAHNDD